MNKTLITLIACGAVLTASIVDAGTRTRLRNICRIKGQEENTFRGMGLVVGLNGTGEANDVPTMRALARSMQLLGSPVSNTGRLDEEATEALRKVKNAALVMVTATAPATGARRGDKLDCYVSAINGKSLQGGRLAFAALQGPNTQDSRVYATCEGQIQIEDDSQPMVGVVHGGCQMQQDIFTPFHQGGFFTLVLDKNHAGFHTAERITHRIRQDYHTFLPESVDGSNYEAVTRQCVRTIDAANIVVRIPDVYRDDPVAYAALVLDIDIVDSEPEARVVINPRALTVSISGDVEIGETVILHRNLVVEATDDVTFTSVDQGDFAQPKLDRLLKALDALKVQAEDVIEIIRVLDRSGKLHAKLIVE